MNNPYLKEFGHNQPPFQVKQSGNDGWDRKDLIRQYAHAIPSAEAATTAAQYAQKIVEIGAGNGYWAWFFSQAGIDVLAFDLYPDHSFWKKKWFDVKFGYTTVAKKFPDRALMLVWPCAERMSKMASHALQSYEGDTVIYVGEPQDGKGLTAGEEFFGILESRFEVAEIVWLPRWAIYYDHMAIYVKKETN